MPNSRGFSGTVTLITGSSSGIGAATAISLSKAGAQVVMRIMCQKCLKNVKKCHQMVWKHLKLWPILSKKKIASDWLTQLLVNLVN